MRITQPEVILQHPRSPVDLDPPPSDPREQAVADFRPTAAYAPEMPTPEEWSVLDGQEAIYRLIHKYGAARVMTWVRNLAIIAGQEIS